MQVYENSFEIIFIIFLMFIVHRNFKVGMLMGMPSYLRAGLEVYATIIMFFASRFSFPLKR